MINGRSPIISDGEADVILAFEPLEALRALRKGHRNTTVITSLAQIQPFTVAIGSGKYPVVDHMLAVLKSSVRKVAAFDAMALAKSAGNPLGVNMVMLGALLGAEDIFLSEPTLRDIIRTRTKPAFVDANMKCFDLGLRAAVESGDH